MEKEGNEVSGSLGAHLSAPHPHPWPRTSETHSHPFTFLPCVLLITSFPTVLLLPSLLSTFLTFTARSPLSPPISVSGPSAQPHQPLCSLPP